MTTYYVNPATGNDAADGLTWGTAWRTLLNGATFARLGQTDSDEIRIAKSPDPVSIGNVTWTNDSLTFNVPQLTNILVDNGKTGWVQTAGTLTYTTFFRSPGNTLQIAMSAVNGKSAHKQVAALNLSSMTRLSFWVNFGTAVNYTAGCPIQIDLCSDTAGNTPVVRCTLPRYFYPASIWVPIVVEADAGFDFANATSIQSITIRTSAAVTNTIRFDNFFCAGPASSSTSLVLTDLIAKNNGAGEYYPLVYVSGSTVSVCGGGTTQAATQTTPPTNYFSINGTETIDTLKRTCFITALEIPATSSTTAILAFNYTDSHQYPNTKTYIGGVNPVTDLVDGETWFDGVTGWGGGAQQTNAFLANFNITNLGIVRYDRGVWINYPDDASIENISIVDCRQDYLIANSLSAVALDNHREFTFGVKWLMHGAGGARPQFVSATAADPFHGFTRINNFSITNARGFSTSGVVHLIDTGTASASGAPVNFTSLGTILFSGSNAVSWSSAPATFNFNNLMSTNNSVATILMINDSEMSLIQPQTVFNFTGQVGSINPLGTPILLSPGRAKVNINFLGSAQMTGTTPFLIGFVANVATISPIVITRYFGAPLANLIVSGRDKATQISFVDYNRTVGNDFVVTTAASGGAMVTGNRWQRTTADRYGSATYSWNSIYTSLTGSAFRTPRPLLLGTIVVKANEQVTATIRCKRSHNTVNGYLLAFGHDNQFIRVKSNATSITGDWELLTLSFTPTVNTTVNLSAVTEAATGPTLPTFFYFSDLQITQGA